MAIIVDLGAGERDLPVREPRGRGWSERRSASGKYAARTGVDGGRRAPIDHDHLQRYTLGNRDLELEVLGLFVGEAPRTLANLRAAAAGEVITAREWHLGSHTLKGSARAVGAWRVAQLAETAEADQCAGRSVLMAHVAALETAIEEVAAHVADLKRQVEAAG